MADGEVTIAELGRRLERIELQLQSLQYVSREMYLLQTQSLVERIEVLENRSTFYARALVTSVIFPVIVAVIIALALTR